MRRFVVKFVVKTSAKSSRRSAPDPTREIRSRVRVDGFARVVRRRTARPLALALAPLPFRFVD